MATCALDALRRRLRAATAVACAMVQLGCASLVGGPSGAVGPPVDVGRARLVLDETPLRVEFVDIPRSKQEAAGTAAGRFFAECAIQSSRTIVVVPLYLFMLAGCTAGTPVAAGVAAHQALSEEEVARSAAVVSEATALAEFHADLRRVLAQAGEDVAPGRLVLAADGAADSELRLAMKEFGLYGDGTADGLVQFRFTVDASLHRPGDGAVLRSIQLRHPSEMRRLREWTADGARPVRLEVERAMARVAESVVDFAFLLYPFPYVGLPGLTSEFTGLQGVYPPQRQNLFKPHAVVDTLRPVFRWEAFPREVDLQADPATMRRVTGATYDLAVTDRTGEVIYRRERLPANEHAIGIELAPGTFYSWTVRARFTLDGREYVTEWAEKGRLSRHQANQRYASPSRFGYWFRTE